MQDEIEAGVSQPKAEDFYRKLTAEVQNKQRLENLRILWEVLLEQRDRGAIDFSVVLISRLTKARGGLAESSIRNAAGRDYQTLIRLFADEVKAAAAKKGRGVVERKGSWEQDMLAQIPDMGLRARVAILVSANRQLKNELDLLRNAIARDYVMPEKIARRQEMTPLVEAPNSGADAARAGEILPPAPRLLGAEIDAIRHFLSDDHMRQQQWTIQSNGTIKDGATTIARVGFANALRKIAGG